MIEHSFTDLLEEIVDNRGRTCPTADSGLPLIATNCIKDDHLYPVFENVRYVDEKTVGTWFRGHPRPNDIIFVCKGSPGRIAMVPDPVTFCIAQDMVALRADQRRVHPRYLYYALKSPTVQAKISNMHVGSMIPHFKKGDFGKLRFSIHEDVEEQRAIANVLGALDDKITANTNLATTADDLLATRFESIVGAASETIRLGELADVNRATVKPSPDGQLRYIDIASVEVGSFKFPSPTPWIDAPSRARRAICRGDTLWSTVRPNRRSHALNLSDDPLLVGSTGLAILTPRTVGWAYLYEVTRRPEFTSYLETVAEGSAYPAVRADKFGEALVPLADEASQRSFERLAEPLREQVHSLDQENRTLADTRDALLPQLMSGKLRVRDAEKVLENAGL